MLLAKPPVMQFYHILSHGTSGSNTECDQGLFYITTSLLQIFSLLTNIVSYWDINSMELLTEISEEAVHIAHTPFFSISESHKPFIHRDRFWLHFIMNKSWVSSFVTIDIRTPRATSSSHISIIFILQYSKRIINDLLSIMIMCEGIKQPSWSHIYINL